MDIIELLADAESGLTVSEISERLKRSMSELFRIIVVMERRGWLQKESETSRYSVTYHLLKIAHRSTPAQTLTSAAGAGDARPVDPHQSVLSSRRAIRHAGSRDPAAGKPEAARQPVGAGSAPSSICASSCSGHVLLAHLATPNARRCCVR